ncbi:MAG: hypothetical protein LKH59_07605 [Lactobacillus crispatus]|nr:hypothetical protein [Lactobacillus crispatus]MCI1336524.1 hypothetical protein [Lactobacillus crispatus]MCI1366024.1 hypothetical protein [Lactobacillus crispatus]MCI1494397.1 hypothetical protein [Lactobacillus crispatus]MCI1525061.1 hypothetical protein [Lactobacillus crispatus]
MQVINSYTVHTDSKRITFKPKGISNKALKAMDESIANFEKGKVSVPVDLSDF